MLMVISGSDVQIPMKQFLFLYQIINIIPQNVIIYAVNLHCD